MTQKEKTDPKVYERINAGHRQGWLERQAVSTITDEQFVKNWGDSLVKNKNLHISLIPLQKKLQARVKC